MSLVKTDKIQLSAFVGNISNYCLPISWNNSHYIAIKFCWLSMTQSHIAWNWYYMLIVLAVEFAAEQFVGSESSGFIEIIVRIREGSSGTPITVRITPSVQSPVSARGNLSDDY